jgi:hypothetical protein
MAGNGERLKGSQLGYRGKGVPDLDTILMLQDKYAAAVLAGGLPRPIVSPKVTALKRSPTCASSSSCICRPSIALETRDGTSRPCSPARRAEKMTRLMSRLRCALCWRWRVLSVGRR